MTEQIDNGVWRREVPGGWIYTIHNASLSAAVFVPFPSSADAVARERSRCAKIVADRIDGGADTKDRPHISDVGLTIMIEQIERGEP